MNFLKTSNLLAHASEDQRGLRFLLLFPPKETRVKFFNIRRYRRALSKCFFLKQQIKYAFFVFFNPSKEIKKECIENGKESVEAF